MRRSSIFRAANDSCIGIKQLFDFMPAMEIQRPLTISGRLVRIG